MDRYEIVGAFGTGTVQLGVVMMAKEIATGEHFAIKIIDRGNKIESIEPAILNHRLLRHPNIIGLKEVILTNRRLGIVMEYAAGGRLFDNVRSVGGLTEDLARCLFQQLIAAVSYIHSADVCLWDLRLESTLIDRPLCNGNPAPRLKICDFGVSKLWLLSHENAKDKANMYNAPEALTSSDGNTYDKKMATVWACGVALYVMLVGSFPFDGLPLERVKKIIDARFSFPDHVSLSMECKDLISRIFTADPGNRITIPEIRSHSWFNRNLPNDMGKGEDFGSSYPLRSLEEISSLVDNAKILVERPLVAGVPVEAMDFAHGANGYDELSDGSGSEDDD